MLSPTFPTLYIVYFPSFDTGHIEPLYVGFDKNMALFAHEQNSQTFMLEHVLSELPPINSQFANNGLLSIRSTFSD